MSAKITSPEQMKLNKSSLFNASGSFNKLYGIINRHDEGVNFSHSISSGCSDIKDEHSSD